MKTIKNLFIAFLLAGAASASAQTTPVFDSVFFGNQASFTKAQADSFRSAEAAKIKTETVTVVKKEAATNYYLMKDDKLVHIHDGKTMKVEKDITLENGKVIMTNGIIKNNDGRIIKLKTGERVDMNGNTIVDMPAVKKMVANE